MGDEANPDAITRQIEIRIIELADGRVRLEMTPNLLKAAKEGRLMQPTVGEEMALFAVEKLLGEVERRKRAKSIILPKHLRTL